MSRPLHERLDRPDRARHDTVEALLRSIIFGARVHGLYVAQAEGLRSVLDELTLLRGRVDQRELELRHCDRERQTRKTGAGADVRDARAAHMAVDGETVEQVLGDLLTAFADRGQIHALVPVVELVEESQQLARLVGAQRNAEL